MLHVRERPRQPAPLERALAQYWRDHGASLPPLQCDDGSRLRVVYPGRASSAAGPDFRDAVLQRESGEVVRGDVELHLRRRGWEAHGHHTDSGYNGVVLHVVLHGGDTPITLASGRRVPTAALFPRTLGARARRETRHRGRCRSPRCPRRRRGWPARSTARATPASSRRCGASLYSRGQLQTPLMHSTAV